MLNIQRILLATDFSAGAEWRMAYAYSFARRTGAELHVLYADVLHGDASTSTAGPFDSHEGALENLRQLASRTVADSNAEVRFHVERNISAAPAILDYSDDHDVDLIVMGTHGRRGVRRLVLGSVAEEVLRIAKCPILTIRSREDAPPPDLKISSILVPVDFSDHARSALAHASEIARLFEARLDLLHVVEETLHPAFYGLTVQSVYDVDPDIEQKAVKHMKEMLNRIGQPAAGADFEARPGSAAREIVDYAAERDAGVIVMGTHGLTGLDHFLMGSTTERVLRRSSRPVFTVKSYGKTLLDDGSRS